MGCVCTEWFPSHSRSTFQDFSSAPCRFNHYGFLLRASTSTSPFVAPALQTDKFYDVLPLLYTLLFRNATTPIILFWEYLVSSSSCSAYPSQQTNFHHYSKAALFCAYHHLSWSFIWFQTWYRSDIFHLFCPIFGARIFRLSLRTAQLLPFHADSTVITPTALLSYICRLLPALKQHIFKHFHYFFHFRYITISRPHQWR